jgi:D-glycerate 3-kinase
MGRRDGERPDSDDQASTAALTPASLQRRFDEEGIPAAAAGRLAAQYDEIITAVLAARSRHAAPMVLGICGSQGSGKSTLARVLRAVLQDSRSLSVAVLSIDDLYLSRAERGRLAREVHPLLQTRGVPGTHDIALGIDVIRRLLSAAPGDITRLPRFDKAVDEPVASEHWEVFRGRADLVIFEGWCVGSVPEAQAALAQPINALERDEDPGGHWRRYVNEQLAGPYQGLFGLLNRLLMIQAPGFEAVFEWRREQERKLEATLSTAPAASARRIMSDDELRRFIAHYERLTRHTLAEMPARADLLMRLDAQRRIVAIVNRLHRE